MPMLFMVVGHYNAALGATAVLRPMNPTPRTVSAHPHLFRYRRRQIANPTEAEERIAKCLTAAGIRYEFQQVFYDSTTKVGYIADFWLLGRNVVIECDGAHHRRDASQRSSDQRRDALFLKAGVRTLRLTNQECLRITFWVLKELFRAGTVKS